MKVLIAEPLRLKTVPMGDYAARALRQLGHTVTRVDFSPRWSDKLRKGVGRKSGIDHRFLEQVDAVQPDLCLTIFGFYVSPEALEELRQRSCVSVCWWLNDPFQFERSMLRAAHYDWLFTNDRGSVAAYQAQGINAHWLPTACDPTVHRPVDPRPEWRCDVAFAGDWSAMRERWMQALAQRFDVKVFGPWGKKLDARSPLRNHLVDGFFSGPDMAAMFASAKVVFNIHTWREGWTHGTNPRLFEAAACRSFQAVDRRDELPELFDVNTDLLVYDELDDLMARLPAVLEDASLRQSVSNNAYARSLAQHTYVHRMQTLLSAVGA